MDAEHGDLQDCCWRSTEGISSFMDVVRVMLPRLAALFVHPGVACCGPVALAVSLLALEVETLSSYGLKAGSFGSVLGLYAQALGPLCTLSAAHHPQLLLS